MKQEHYKGVYWTPEDLISSAQAVCILYGQEGVDLETLNTLDFGSLDIEGVLDEEFGRNRPGRRSPLRRSPLRRSPLRRSPLRRSPSGEAPSGEAPAEEANAI